ncbi:MAG TPA: DUF5010 domain-containing protein [Acidimicrobiales bacterium]
MRWPRSRAGRLGLIALAAALVVVVLGVGAAAHKHAATSSVRTSPPPPPPANVVHALLGATTPPLVVTYLFYWYNAASSQHLRPQDGLPIHLPDSPAPSWQSVPWFETQLKDMTDADINVALPDYWGSSPEQEWSIEGLTTLVQARAELVAEHMDPPSIGMFYDTSIIKGVDLTTEAGINEFYYNIRTFFMAIPEDDWARVDGRPLIWLFLPQDNNFDQRVFDATYARFTEDFKIRPFIVRATGWNCATTVANCGERIHTDASYVWGVAQDGMQATELVAAAGPGYDDRLIPGRAPEVVPREGGAYYRKNLAAAVRSGRPIVAIETWNEIHEASAICETVEYGRTYIDLTRSIVETARQDGA